MALDPERFEDEPSLDGSRRKGKDVGFSLESENGDTVAEDHYAHAADKVYHPTSDI